MNRSAGQTNCVKCEAVLGRFVVLRYDSFPMNPENSLNKFNILYPLYLQCVQEDSF